MKAILIILAGAIMFTSCETRKPESIVIKKFAVVKTYRVQPISIHDEMSPRWKAVLSNTDTVPCTGHTRVGDSITYKFIKYGRK
jgi:hypothetical protein